MELVKELTVQLAPVMRPFDNGHAKILVPVEHNLVF